MPWFAGLLGAAAAPTATTAATTAAAQAAAAAVPAAATGAGIGSVGGALAPALASNIPAAAAPTATGLTGMLEAAPVTSEGALGTAAEFGGAHPLTQVGSEVGPEFGLGGEGATQMAGGLPQEGFFTGLKDMLAKRYGLTKTPETAKDWMDMLSGLGQMQSDMQTLGGGDEGASAPDIVPGTAPTFGPAGGLFDWGATGTEKESPQYGSTGGGYLDMLAGKSPYRVPGYW